MTGKSGKKGKYPLGVVDPALATAIQENLGISCRADETIREIIRGIRLHYTSYVKPLAGGLLEQSQLGLGHSYSRTKVKLFLAPLRSPHQADMHLLGVADLKDDTSISSVALTALSISAA